MCLDSGTISCFGAGGRNVGELPAPPGSDAVSDSPNASNLNLSLTAQAYSPNQIELFYNRIPSVLPVILAEAVRTMLLITHEIGFAFHFADRVLILCDGVIHEQGTPDQVFNNLQKQRTRALLSRQREFMF